MMLGEDDFSQPRDFYQVIVFRFVSFLERILIHLQKVLNHQGRANLINNIADSLRWCTDRNIVHRILVLLSHIDRDFGTKMAETIRF